MAGPIAEALKRIGVSVVRETVASELQALRRAPGVLVAAQVHHRIRQVRAQGREPTEQDLADIIDDLPEMAAWARAQCEQEPSEGGDAR